MAGRLFCGACVRAGGRACGNFFEIMRRGGAKKLKILGVTKLVKRKNLVTPVGGNQILSNVVKLKIFIQAIKHQQFIRI